MFKDTFKTEFFRGERAGHRSGHVGNRAPSLYSVPERIAPFVHSRGVHDVHPNPCGGGAEKAGGLYAGSARCSPPASSDGEQ
jgi:hypothetical protein